MEAMWTHYFRTTPRAHVLVHHEPEYVRRSEVPHGPTPEQALESQRSFSDTFFTTDSKLERLFNTVLHQNSCHL